MNFGKGLCMGDLDHQGSSAISDNNPPDDKNEEPQEIPDAQDLNSCWRVIARQTQIIENQQASLADVNNKLAALQLQLTQLIANTNDNGNQNIGNTPVTIGQMTQLFDNKGEPPPEPFTLSSGQAFDKFIKQFETYCRKKYSADSYERWTSELEQYLKDEIKQMFKLLGGGEVELTIMKERLRNYCISEEANSLTRNLEKFTSMTQGPDESSYMYLLRLERLFALGYPGIDPETSPVLYVKFLASIRESERLDIQRDLDTVSVASASPINSQSWKKVVELVKRRHDRNIRVTSQIKTEPTLNEPFSPIWFTSTNVQDARYSNPYEEQRSRPLFRGNRGNRHGSFSREYWRSDRDNQVTHNRSRSLSNNRNTRGNRNSANNVTPPRNQVYCDWCGNPGHVQTNCWRRLGYCLRCGSDRHVVRQCPRPSRFNREPSLGGAQNARGRQRQRQPSGNRHPVGQNQDNQPTENPESVPLNGNAST